jgi:8-oxo-dGTP pyrophosphatase MutT (NUDIX family)
VATKENERSYGGVVVRGDEVAVIVPHKTGPEGQPVLGLPKGHAEAAETPEQAATREVREETGLTTELVAPLGDVEYWYQRKGRRIHKQVTFFLFRFRDGSLDDHDHEIAEARWMPLTEAAQALTFPGERQMVARALSHLGAER